jgi:nucleotide-binding universal stress UspA family protein
LARATGASLAAIRIVEAGQLPEPDEALVAMAKTDLELTLANVSLQLRARLYVELGQPCDAICKVARADGTDIIVVGAHRYALVERVLGTTAAQILNQSDCSVLVIRGLEELPRRILVGLGDSEGAAIVREYAVALARSVGAKLRLFHAVDLPTVVPADMMAQYPTTDSALREAADRALKAHAAQVPSEVSDGFGAGTGEPWRAIAAEAHNYGAQLIVVGSRRSTLRDRLLGTTAAKLVNRANRSVLVVRRAWGDTSRFL